MNGNNDNAEPNPRETIGGNRPPLPKLIFADNENFAATVAAYLEDEYGEMRTTVEALLAEAETMPKIVSSDEEAGKITALIVRIKDAAARFEKTRLAEGNPYLAATGVINAWYFGLIDRIKRRDRKNRPGLADDLLARLDEYNQKKLAAEQALRRKAAEDAAREAREKKAEEDRAAAAAEEARLAAERARAPKHVETKKEIAAQADSDASAAAVDSVLAQGKADEAHIDTLAKPAEMMRTRFEGGGMNTMQTVAFAVVETEAELDKEKLWPFISLDAKEQALRAWAKNTGYTQQMPGALIGRKPKTVVRK